MSEALDEIRTGVYRDEKNLNKRKVLKGTRRLLHRNGRELFDEKFKSRLYNALNLKEALMKAYYQKENFKEIRMQSVERKPKK